MKTWFTVSEGAEYAGREPRHDLHRVRAWRAALRQDRRASVDSDQVAVDRMNGWSGTFPSRRQLRRWMMVNLSSFFQDRTIPPLR